jgi:hypothetical protein
MTFTRRRAVVFVAAALLCSCVSQKPQPPTQTVASTTLSRSADAPRRVFVLAKLGQSMPEPFADGYLAALAQELGGLGATVSTMKLTGLELDRRAPDKAREAFAPDMTFTVVFEARLSSNSTHTGVVMVQLVDARGDELWNSQQVFAFPSFAATGKGIIKSGTRAGSAAFRQLMADRVFPGTI